jgi:peptide-methionine (S)-S-oxide reductase
MKTIVLGGGCFWCVEALFQQVNGINEVISGYAGGTLRNPTYENIGDHAEVVQLAYDESTIPLDTIFDIFLHIHDPTTVDRQGNDIGPQYRSIILCNDHLEAEIARRVIDGNRENWHNPIVTQVDLLDAFYPAEEYHQNYFNNHPENAYCQVVINPKLAKFSQKFKNYLKQE